MHRRRHHRTATTPQIRCLAVVASSEVVGLVSMKDGREVATVMAVVGMDEGGRRWAAVVRTDVALPTDVSRPTPNASDPVCGVESAHEQRKHRLS